MSTLSTLKSFFQNKVASLEKRAYLYGKSKEMTNIQRFIQLQTRVNHLIDSTDGPTELLVQLTDELSVLGDSLNYEEIDEVCKWYNSRREILVEKSC